MSETRFKTIESFPSNIRWLKKNDGEKTLQGAYRYEEYKNNKVIGGGVVWKDIPEVEESEFY